MLILISRVFLVVAFAGVAVADRIDDPSYTLFLAHYDGTTGNSGRDADLASGSTAMVGSGGQIVATAKFGNGSLDVSGNTLGSQTRYDVVGNFNNNTGTVDMWVQTENWGQQADVNGASLLTIWNSPAWSGAIYMRVVDAKLAFLLSDAFGANWWEYETAVLTVDSAWHHVAFDWDFPAGQIGVYLDGVPQALTQVGGGWSIDAYNGTWGAPFEVGTMQGGYNAWRGQIDELRVSSLDRYQGQAFTPQMQAWQSGPPPDPFCGDALHPIPDGDLNLDCIVNILDFALVNQYWMVDTNL
jgi:hypothetical protein